MVPKMQHAQNVENDTKEQEAAKYTDQAEHLAQYKHSQENDETGSTQAARAKFITPLDPVVETADGGRLPVIPVKEAVKLNRLKEKTEGQIDSKLSTNVAQVRKDATSSNNEAESEQTDKYEAPLRKAIPPSR